MALTIIQSDLYRFERLVTKLTKPSEPPVVTFIPCSSDTTKLAAFCKDAILTMPVALLETAMQIQQDLRKSLVQVDALIKEVKAQKQQDWLLRSTMDNLRKLSL